MSVLSEEVLTPVERMECQRIGERLAPFYRVTDWRWAFPKPTKTNPHAYVMRVPNAQNVTDAIEDMAARAIKAGEDHPGYGIMSGGLTIIFTGPQPDNDPGDPNSPSNHLRFIVRLDP